MVTPEMIAAAEAVPIMCGTYGIAAEDAVAIYLAMHAARPTADLGEDGELVEELLFAVRELTGMSTAKKNEVESLTGLSFGAIADYTQRAADRLILYREALENCLMLACNYALDEKRARNEIVTQVRAVLSRSGG